MLRVEHQGAPARVNGPAPRRATVPFTHHEILRWVEPFTRAGRPVDLAASDRSARRLAFRTVEHAAGGGLPVLREQLTLHHDEPGGPFRLLRTLTAAGGLQATLEAEGPEAGPLLARIEAVPPARQFSVGPGHAIALGQQAPAAAQAGEPPPAPRLLRATARVADLQLEMTVPRVHGVPAKLELRPLPPTAAASYPEDLLAVLGLDWSRLARWSGGWRANLRLRGRDAARGADAQAKLLRTVQHLAAVLAAPPGEFHDRFSAARWGVVLRRAVPLAVVLALIGAAAAVPLLGLGSDSVLRMLIFNAPPLLLLWMFSLRELPRIEIPPLPRRPAADAWDPATAVP